MKRRSEEESNAGLFDRGDSNPGVFRVGVAFPPGAGEEGRAVTEAIWDDMTQINTDRWNVTLPSEPTGKAQ